MGINKNTLPVVKKFQLIRSEAERNLLERDEELHLLLLALASGLNILLLGPPGVAKSMLIRQVVSHIKNCDVFDFLMSKFTTPDEIFGPYSIKALEQDEYKRITTKRLPEAHIGYLDETFKSGGGNLNSLLEVMNERTFTNGTVKMKTPLITIIGASNELPDEEDGLAALYDRFDIKRMVLPIQERTNQVKLALLPDPLPAETFITFDDLNLANQEIKNVVMPEEMAEKLAILRRDVEAAKIIITDRTYRRSIRLLQAEAWYHERDHVTEEDFEILQHAWWDDPKETRTLHSRILETTNPEKQELIDIFNESMQSFKDIHDEQDIGKQMEKASELRKKMGKTLKRIDVLLREMKAKGKEVADLEEMKSKIQMEIAEVYKRVFNMSSDI